MDEMNREKIGTISIFFGFGLLWILVMLILIPKFAEMDVMIPIGIMATVLCCGGMCLWEEY